MNRQRGDSMALRPTRRSPKRILLSIPHMGGTELEYVREAFATNWLSTAGPHLDALESEFSRLVGLPATATNTGTAALHLALRLAGVGPGEEAAVPTFTFVASCNPILYQGAVPVFIDSEYSSWNMHPGLLADFLKKRADVNRLPKAVVVVHLFGQAADMDPILEACARYDLPVIEDAAEALGATYGGKPVGTMGAVGIYSFNGNKIVTATAGGMLVSPNAAWVSKARYWSTQARDSDPDLDSYLHSEVGYNYRMSNVLAAVARGQLGFLPERIAQRRAIAFRYRDAFADMPGIELMPQAPNRLHTNWLSCFLIDEAKSGLTQAGLVRFLEDANIASRPVWKPMHTQKLYQACERVGGAVAEDLGRRGICLPSSSSLALDDQQFVIDRVREAYRLARTCAP